MTSWLRRCMRVSNIATFARIATLVTIRIRLSMHRSLSPTFRRSSNHFHDPDFDGIPEVIKKFKDDDNIEINETHYDEAEDIEKNPVKKLKVET